MINTVFHFVNDPTFDYTTAVQNGDISEYTIVFNAADRSIHCKNQMYGRMSRADIAEVLGDMSDLLPAATANKLGAVKLGYTADANAQSRRYALKLDENNRGYVEVPWTDTVTPVYDDTELQGLIDRQRARIDSYVNDLVQTVQECTETLLRDTQWVTDNLAAGETGRQINDNINEFMRIQYGVWGWIDDNDHSQGKFIKTSVIEQQVDSIKAYTGMTVPSDYAGTNLTTALSRIYEDVGRDFESGEITAGTGMMADIADINTDTGNIVKAIASALDLKASQNGNTLNTTADLASVISNGAFTGYSGLNTRVTQTESDINGLSQDLSAESNLLARVVNSDGTFTTDALSGIASSTQISDTVADARTSLISDINGKSAGITVFATKTGNAIDTGITLNADQITLSGITMANTIFARFAEIEDLRVTNGRITNLESDNVTINNKLTANEAEFHGTLKGATGSFSGSVNASQFVAGDESGLNVTITDDAVSFNYGSDQRAWFTTKSPSGTQSSGMYLYIKNPDQTASNSLITIDFANLAFKAVGSGTQRAIQQTDIYSTMTGSNVQYAPNIFKGEFDDLYYNNSALGSSNLLTDSSYHQYIKTGYVVISNNSKYRLYQAKIYDKVSFSSGVKTNSNSFYAVLYDTAGNVLSGTRISGSYSQTTISDPDNTVILGSGSDTNTVGHGGNLWFSKTNNAISPRLAHTGSGGGTITLYRFQAVGPQGVAITFDRDVSLHS